MMFLWRRTFPEPRHDFVAETQEDVHVGRIRRIHGGPQDGTWTWSCTGCQRGHEAEGVRLLNGESSTRDGAIEAHCAVWARATAWREWTGLPRRDGAKSTIWASSRSASARGG